MEVKDVEIHLENNVLTVKPIQGRPGWSAKWGLMRSLLNNMVVGVSKGFKKVLVIEGREYSVKKVPEGLLLNLGFSHPVEFPLPDNVQANVEERAKRIELISPDKQLLGQIVADIRAYRPPEPYKGKGIRFENEVIVRKVGKKAAGK
jgi:large subunit ribosomal protein L6